MKVDIVAPIEFQGSLAHFLSSVHITHTALYDYVGAVIGGINQRKGTIVDTEVQDEEFTMTAEVSLNDMFGYASSLRSITQGKGEFSLTYQRHSPVLPFVQKSMIEEYTSFTSKK